MPDFCLLDTQSTPPSLNNQRHLQTLSLGENFPWLWTTGPRESISQTTGGVTAGVSWSRFWLLPPLSAACLYSSSAVCISRNTGRYDYLESYFWRVIILDFLVEEIQVSSDPRLPGQLFNSIQRFSTLATHENHLQSLWDKDQIKSETVKVASRFQDFVKILSL